MNPELITIQLSARELAQLECMLVAAAILFETNAAESRRYHLGALAEMAQDNADKARRLKATLVAAYVQGA